MFNKNTTEKCYVEDCPFWDADECNKPDDLCYLYDNRFMHEILPELI